MKHKMLEYFFQFEWKAAGVSPFTLDLKTFSSYNPIVMMDMCLILDVLIRAGHSGAWDLSEVGNISSDSDGQWLDRCLYGIILVDVR